MNYQNYLLYDLETVARAGEDARNPLQAEPIQITAKVIHPRKLEFIDKAEFSTYIQPPFPREEIDMGVIEWHSKNKGIKTEEFLGLIYNEKTPKQELVWKNFIEFFKRYHTNNGKSKTIHNAPLLAGHNIISYDNIIFERLCRRYGNVNKDDKQNLTMMNKSIDTIGLLWFWTENNPELDSQALDKVRPYFGLSNEGGHDSSKDVDDCAAILTRFLKLHRLIASKTKFKGSFSGKN